MELEGTVINGIGVAKYWVGKITEVFLKKTNMKLYLGTLNIKLKTKYLLNPDFIIKKEEFEGTQNVLTQRCRIFNKEAYIVRAEKNQNGTGDHDLSIIEIVSDINLRETYNLRNNQRIRIEI